MQARRKEEGRKQPWERGPDPEIAPLSDRLRNTVRELLRRDPMREDDSYLNPESIPRIGLGEQAIREGLEINPQLLNDFPQLRGVSPERPFVGWESLRSVRPKK